MYLYVFVQKILLVIIIILVNKNILCKSDKVITFFI